MKKSKPIGLGKGLGALIPRELPTAESIGTLRVDDGTITGATALIEITKVRPNRYQPRQDFDASALEELTRSIKEKGVIQPITVRRVDDGYELIAGERRVRASIEAGLTMIPAYILDVERDTDMLELALIENVQRENLNPIEVALGYQRLIEECHLTQEEVAAKVGKDRTTITNFLRLLKLSEPVQEALRTKKITMGHARALLAIQDHNLQARVLEDIITKDLSVRATEALVRDVELGKVRYDNGKQVLKKAPSAVENPDIQRTLAEIERQLRAIFATNVRVKTKSSSGAGTIEIDFYSIEDLERLLDLFILIERSL
ncbi:MAG: ParB/RepB/Spo0J family partition protein [Bacteroidota bacterium]|nr:ParB/RepB/Spo0J family partition protein [Candidatus Kapabacteria bacterium]MCS7302212.1 ParB/RepB/Spo0J family partition protein [Candidatus Kapabacteria bacterium]MDW8074832.1 ParB/RepB/Spo0J family partition protein [Bacteroidota bacterium]MDW8271471.1 ParB/RepB/Spo0J family partition protein [Bacteroidota bacterium]